MEMPLALYDSTSASLALECEALDRIVAPGIRRRSKNLRSTHTDNVHQLTSVGGQGYQQLRIGARSATQMLLLQQRFLLVGDPCTRRAADALPRRGNRLSHTVPLFAITPQDERPGCWISSLISFCSKGNTCLTKQCSFPASQACSTPHQSLLGTPVQSNTWSTSNIKCLHPFHLSSYGDIFEWYARLQQSWDWQKLEHMDRSF